MRIDQSNFANFLIQAYLEALIFFSFSGSLVARIYLFQSE